MPSEKVNRNVVAEENKSGLKASYRKVGREKDEFRLNRLCIMSQIFFG